MLEEEQKEDEEEKFKDMSLDKEILQALARMKIHVPTKIQKETIPLILSGADVLGQAHTGTGKTAAFGIPMLMDVGRQKGLRSVIITPTRELAKQVAEELQKLGRFYKIRIAVIYGGVPSKRQIEKLRSAQIAVATPGRFMDLMNRGFVPLKNISWVVLDEADRMLDMGFIDDIKYIMKQMPRKRRTLMFSATFPKEIQRLAYNFQHDPIIIDVTNNDHLTVDSVDQSYILVDRDKKADAFLQIIDEEEGAKALVFCNTKKMVDRLARALQNNGLKAEAMHGDISQNKRENILNRFRKSDSGVLVATDVAARGIDIRNITHVINYDVPTDADDYVHRIGRTARMGQKGKAITLVTVMEGSFIGRIERHIGMSITKYEFKHPEKAPKEPYTGKDKNSWKRPKLAYSGGGRKRKNARKRLSRSI